MTRHLQYIFLALIAGLMSVSCIQELELETPVVENDVVTLVPRVQSFANKYVTKAEEPYSDHEKKISTLTVLIFNSAGNFVYKKELSSGATSFTLNKSLIATGDMETSTVVMLANIALGELTTPDGVINDDNIKDLTVFDLEASTYTPPSSIPSVIKSDALSSINGLPMIGGQKVNLSASKDQQSPIEIGLKMLYAKVKFQIAVAAEGSENQYLHDGVNFNMTGCTINNTTHTTTLAIPDNKEQAKVDFLGIPLKDDNDVVITAEADGATPSSSYDDSGETSIIDSASEISKGGQLNLTFYILESRFNHGVDVTTIYPWKDAYGNVLEGYESYQQMYKPMLVTEAGNPNKGGKGLATNVRLSGTYTDYRGTDWNVDYTVYLGKDNSQNFQVDRNSEYTNIITIKGIRNSSSVATGEGEVWIDHRVNVSYADDSADDCVTITRQTLIDSHIEVRPLRVKWGKDSKGNDLYTFARVYLPYYTQDNGTTWVQRDEVTSSKKNWIGIELGDKTGSLYCSGNDNPSKGKRKYFTESLVSELNDIKENTDIVSEGGDKFIALSNNQCAWVYIDEYWNDESAAANPATVNREAKIVVDFCTIENNSIKVKNREEYILSQQPLINIYDGKYYVENYEEYLYSYDSHDRYSIETSPTDYTGQGLEWGFTKDGTERVSKSQFVTKKVISDWAPTNNEAYDFIHENDKVALGEDYMVVDKNGGSIDLSKNNGYNFTYNASANNGVTVSRMDKMPENAYQYCLSKNKFKEGSDGEGNEMLIRWYVPDVYELSDIFQYEQSPLSDDSYYWSSQVPYNIVQNSIIGTIASEDESNARAVSKGKGIEPKERSSKHKIRCLYNRNGEEANMEDRTPEGVGGLIKIPMTVKDNGYFNHTPWFTKLGVIETDYSGTTYRYPMGDTHPVGNKDRDEADNYFGGKIVNGVHYYAKNPLDSDKNWGKASALGITTYTAMHPDNWPGLSNMEAEEVTLDRYQLTDQKKQDTRTYTSRSGNKIDALPSNVNEVPLDHNEESKNNLQISFDKGKNSSNSPKYQYYNENGANAVQQIWVKYWNVPEYSSTELQSELQTYSAPERDVTYDENEVLSAINYAINGLISGSLLDSERCTYLSHSITPITTKSIYSYASASAARSAANDYFENVINVNKEYLSNPTISTSSKEIQLCSYTYTYKKEKRDWIWGWISHWGDWYDNGTGTGSGTITETLYTYVIKYQKPNGTFYQYVAGTGGWGEEVALSEEPVSVDPEFPNVDALTFYAGNTFAISCTKPNCYIRSVKVNYNNSTITDQTAYLRFVDNSKGLPDENKEPEQMTYLDGANGWSKWTSKGDDTEVTLRLVIYEQNSHLFNWWNPDMVHKDPTSTSDRNRSLIINSLEIRLEEKR